VRFPAIDGIQTSIPVKLTQSQGIFGFVLYSWLR
jgi:hypothetical protein